MATPFDEREVLEATHSENMFGGTVVEFKYPVSPREGFLAVYKKQPIWTLTGSESVMIAPKVNPDNIARGFVFDRSGFPTGTGGGPDMFGIEWEYIEQVGGSMVRPGKPFAEDANEICDKVVWPDIDKWDWAESARQNASYADSDKAVIAWFMNGWFERLISFMDFEGAIMALFDEDQKDAVKDFFDKLSDLYIRIFEKYIEHFPYAVSFCVHDDWGSQKETFFSPAVASEMIVPYMRKVTDYLHSQGKFCEIHSCGQAFKQVPNFIAAGWDSWSGQAMNDTAKIYEEYGDKIILGVYPEPFDIEATSEEKQRELGREFADKFAKPGKPATLNGLGVGLTVPFFEGLYKQSRLNYAK